MSGEVFSHSFYSDPAAPFAITFLEGKLSFLAGQERVAFSATLNCRVVKDARAPDTWKVRTEAYIYSIGDARGREVLAYHWHPKMTPEILHPHLHIRKTVSIGTGDLSKAHLPTGRISIEEVVRLLITEFGVEPHQSQWETTLEETQRMFERYRTWPTSTPPTTEILR